jgi:hypothetical protein
MANVHSTGPLCKKNSLTGKLATGGGESADDCAGADFFAVEINSLHWRQRNALMSRIRVATSGRLYPVAFA